jgi:TPR repeat protein
VSFVPSFACRIVLSLSALAAFAITTSPATAGMEEAVKAMQANDLATAEKELQVLLKERDPRAQLLVGLYIYGNPDSKMYDPGKATPLLLDAAERGYVTAMLPLAGAYADGKGIPKSAYEAYKWLLIAERWNAPIVPQSYEQLLRELKPDEVEKAKQAAAAYTFKTK